MTLIQAHLPVCQFAERHRLLVTAHPADLLDAVTLPGTIDDAWVKRLISWRELPGRFLSRFGSKNALGRRAAFGIGDFTLLGREDDLEIAFGLAGRFWRFDYGLVPLRGPEEFDAMSTAGVGRSPDGDVRLSETTLRVRDEDAPMKGRSESTYRYTVIDTIGGGSSEIQKNIIARRKLGLPKNF